MKKKIQDNFHLYPITCLFITISIIISTITWFGYIYPSLSLFVYDQHLIMTGQLWRLVTPIFLHFPALDIVFAHLFFNMIWLFYFGQPIERFESSKFLLIFILIASIVSNVAQGMLSDDIFGGMSGVVYALLGYSFLKGNIKNCNAIRIPDNIAYFLIGAMVLSAMGVFGDGIANTSHIVGFLIGLVFAFFKSIRH